MCSFGSCKTRFEFLSQFRKVRNAFECFVTQVQTRLPKTKRVWPMKINVICTVYGDTKSCVRHNNQLSELFSCVIGVRQGENLSPLLFALYLNDLRTYLSNSCPGMEIRVNSGGDTDIYMKLSVLLYADDTILISDTPQDLQKSLNALHDYCNMWKLTINTSKIVVFSRGKVKKIPNWHIGDNEIGTQYEYTYLGTAFNYNGRFNKAKAKQVAQAKRALFGLIV